MASIEHGRETVIEQFQRAQDILTQIEVGDVITIPPYDGEEEVTGTIVGIYTHLILVKPEEGNANVSVPIAKFKSKPIKIVNKAASESSVKMLESILNSLN